jgi:regulator of sigma E protease
VCSEFAKDVGFQNGDKIISIDGKKEERFFDINQNMVLRDEAFVVRVDRNNRYMDIQVGENFIKHWKNSGKRLLFSPAQIGEIGGFTKDSNAKKAGLLDGDVLIAVEGVKTKYFQDFKNEVQKHKSKTVKIDVLRNNNLYSYPVNISSDGFVGIMIASKLEFAVENFSIVSCFPAGYNLAVDKLGGYISQFALIFNSDNDLAGELGGFGAIGNMFPSVWDWQSFWSLTAFLSLMLAFMNLLPIPALDGGHVMFLLYEMIMGKPAPEKFMEYAQATGMILLLSLLIFANGNDILKLF